MAGSPAFGVTAVSDGNPRDFNEFVGTPAPAQLAFILLPATTSMLAKASALWLAILILLPFSAPFSTCDLASLLPETHSASTPSRPAHHGWPVPSVGDSAASHALPFVRAASRSKLLTASLLDSRGAAVVLQSPRDPRAFAAAPGAAASVSPTPLRI
jgi:hypothetical protein